VFHAEKWVKAFFAVSDNNADEVLFYIKIFVTQVKKIHGAFFGHSASAKLEKVLLESAGSAGIIETTPAALYAIRFVCLLVQKNCFKYIDLLLARIEQMLDEHKGILDITIEAASPPDSAFEEELAQMIREKTGAAEVKIKARVRPELLGGYLLRIGSFYVDASLKGQLEKLSADLNQAAKSAHGGV
jgi:F-type H+-transporting ATPase subunit delta